MLEIRDVTSSNLPDAARLCLAGKTLGDRPRAFTKEIEVDSTRCKLSLLRQQQASGAMAHVAYRDGLLVGYVEHHSIQNALSPIQGEDCRAIHCVRVPEPQERVEVEHALVEHAAKSCATTRGFTVIGRDKDWTSCGFQEVENSPAEVSGFRRVLWWRPVKGGAAPTLCPIDRKLPKIPGKVRVDLFAADRCPWDRYVFDLVREICTSRKRDVVVYETDCNKRANVVRAGVACGVAVNGMFQPWVRPYRLPDAHAVRRAIEDAS